MALTPQAKYDFTIIIPTYNCRTYLPTAIGSILAQDGGYARTQIIVVDDGSTDRTSQLMQGYVQQYPHNIQYISKPNGNWGSVVNYVKRQRLATGRMISILDADDTYLPNALSSVAPFLGEDMVVCDFICLNNNKKRILRPYFARAGLIENKSRLRTPHSQPLGKFYSQALFYGLNDLEEQMWFQDCLLYHGAVSKAKSVRYVRMPIGIWFSTRPGNSTTTPFSDDRKFAAWCKTMQAMSLYGAGSVVYVYGMLPGFIDELKRRNTVLRLPCKPVYAWLPKPLAWLFSCYVWLTSHKWIKYPHRVRLRSGLRRFWHYRPTAKRPSRLKSFS